MVLRAVEVAVWQHQGQAPIISHSEAVSSPAETTSDTSVTTAW